MTTRTNKKTNNSKIFCFIDTEFNAVDYPNQNNGYQEITQIGLAVFKQGKILDRFSIYCKIKPQHTISNRSYIITGISQELLNKEGVCFIDAMKKVLNFIRKYNISKIYAFGPADSIELLTTAKLNNANKDVYDFIKKIKNVYPYFHQKLDLKYSFSLSDICKVFNVEHEKNGRAHSALCDAEDTGYAFFNAKKNLINNKALEKINIHKNNVHTYRQYRSIKTINQNFNSNSTNVNSDILNNCNINKFIQNMDMIMQQSKSLIDNAILTAVYDDVMTLIGRQDLIIGENDL